MKECENTRQHEGEFQHQCPHCGKWHRFGPYGIFQNMGHDLDFTGCCKKYRINRGTVNRIGKMV